MLTFNFDFLTFLVASDDQACVWNIMQNYYDHILLQKWADEAAAISLYTSTRFLEGLVKKCLCSKMMAMRIENSQLVTPFVCMRWRFWVAFPPSFDLRWYRATVDPPVSSLRTEKWSGAQKAIAVKIWCKSVDKWRIYVLVLSRIEAAKQTITNLIKLKTINARDGQSLFHGGFRQWNWQGPVLTGGFKLAHTKKLVLGQR